MVASWSDVWPHHTRGGLFVVPELRHLRAMGEALRDDDVAAVERALVQGTLRRPTDEEIAAWGRAGTSFDVWVVQPWLLATPRDTRPS